MQPEEFLEEAAFKICAHPLPPKSGTSLRGVTQGLKSVDPQVHPGPRAAALLPGDRKADASHFLITNTNFLLKRPF